jgi:multidrug efflux pump subunit AcrA (membrane-fusion protein)
MRSFFVRFCAIAVLGGLAAGSISAQREHTRPGPRRQTGITPSQASELTLTLTEVSVRPIQRWIRTAGAIDDARRTITATVTGADARRVKVGQRIRVFSPESRSRMYQATVAAVLPHGEIVTVRATLMGRALDAGRHFVLEIVTEDGEFLSVPNEAIIETGGKQVVYVHESGGAYAPRDVQVGVQGELFTHVLDGVNAGEQVVTIGSFFIDAEHKLKGS